MEAHSLRFLRGCFAESRGVQKNMRSSPYCKGIWTVRGGTGFLYDCAQHMLIIVWRMLASYLLAAPVPSTRVNIFLQFALVRFRDDTDIHRTKNSQNNQNSSKKTLLIEVDQDSGCSPKPSKSKKPKQRLRKSANLGPWWKASQPNSWNWSTIGLGLGTK